MRHLLLGIAATLGFAVTGAPPVAAADEAAPSAAEKAVRESALAYEKAFNDGDSAALAKLWTENAEFFTDDDDHIVGRKALQERFAEQMEATKGARIEITVESVQSVHDDVAVEKGTARVLLENGHASVSTYTAVHVKKGKAWQMASVHETAVPGPAASEALEDLAWMVGETTFEGENGRVETAARWALNATYIARSFKVFEKDADEKAEPVFQGTQVVGLDPSVGELRTWTFDSSGRVTSGILEYAGGAWREIVGDEEPRQAISTPGVALDALAALGGESAEGESKPINAAELEPLAFLEGEWADSDEEALIHTICTKKAEGRFLVRKITAFVADKADFEGIEIIGWDDELGVPHSWIFDSDGGFADGWWTSKGEGVWNVRIASVRPNGGRASALQVLEKVDDDTFLWQSVSRQLEGELLPGVGPYAIVRVDPEKKEKEAGGSQSSKPKAP